ncbi:TetR/AcrR family transcriptional regulator C-terminal domain-containing protein [Rubrobacter indicoceani]|uniref:TetR/AcrR family transcriptional regulator C-terminal domain-containing protein n=1 Tax=Rubrobacter indicoceani TaxID=2051957 RepID=UPI0013C48DD7|nr:TetR/AcrR family transcriptional regulator C-terminal domain-containing protein [Rubrobacter indicoceani]
MAEKGKLSREKVLEAAVTFVDREGLEALSMRKLGAELGVEAMSLYNHIPNKSALLDGMVRYVLEELEVPRTSDTWEEQIKDGYRRFRRIAQKHPNVFPLLINRPPSFPDGLWLLERYLKIMTDAGFGMKESFHVFRILTNYTFGYAMSEIRGFALEARDGNRRKNRYEIPREFTGVIQLRPYLGNIDHDYEFELGLDLIISGLRDRTSHTRRQPTR